MKWSERGPIPWPIVRRSRFVKELERQGEAYRKTLYQVEAQAAAERARHADKEDEFIETVKHLQGYYDAEKQQFVDVVTNYDQPTHFVSRGITRDASMDAITFHVAVSRMMLERARDLRIVYMTVLSDMVKHMMHEAVEPTVKPF